MGSAQEVLYSWQSPYGTPIETGGTLEHFNQNGSDKRNVRCGSYYTFALNGNYMYMDSGYNVDECSYMQITLADGHVFSKGDEIEVTAMRNNVNNRPSTMFFLFHTPQAEVPLIDTNTWSNLGQGKDSTIGGGTAGAKGSTETSAGANGSAEATGSAAFAPSTHTFTVPKEADGASYVRLSRYQTGDILYVSRFVVRHTATSAVGRVPDCNAHATHATARKYVKDGSIVIERGGRQYSATGMAASR